MDGNLCPPEVFYGDHPYLVSRRLYGCLVIVQTGVQGVLGSRRQYLDRSVPLVCGPALPTGYLRRLRLRAGGALMRDLRRLRLRAGGLRTLPSRAEPAPPTGGWAPRHLWVGG